MIGICNASPLIYLGKIGALSLLQKLFSEVWTTSIVKEEILSKKDAPEIINLEQMFSSWIKIYEPLNETLVNRLKGMNIHEGEASVIALAKEKISERIEKIVIIDDLAAREIARSMGIRITGTIGVLLKGVTMKIISTIECKNFIDILVQQTDFRMSVKVYSLLLTRLKEITE